MNGKIDLKIILQAFDKTQKAFNSVNGNLGKLQNKLKASQATFKKMSMVGVAGLSGILYGMKKLTDTYRIQAKADAQLRAGLESTNSISGMTYEALKKQAQALQKATNYGDEYIEMVQAQILTFTNINKNVFPQTTKAILDIATRMGTDAKSAAIQLGKVLNDPIKNLSALTRVGVQFTDEQEKQIKTLWEAGKQVEAQKIILTELQKEYGGSAEAARKADGGIIAFKNSLGDLEEKIGKAILPVITKLINKLFPLVENFGNWVNKNHKLIGVLAVVVPALFGLLTIIGLIGLALPPLITGFSLLLGPIGLVSLAIGALIAIGTLLYLHWDSVKKYLSDTWGGIKLLFNTNVGLVALTVKKFWTSIKNTTTNIWNSIKDYFVGVWNDIKSIFKDAYDFIMNLLNPLIEAFNKVSSMASSVGSFVGSTISHIGHAVGLASGGIVTRPTLAMIGEGGSPEAVIPLNKLNGFGNIVVNINGGTYLSDEVAEELGDKIIEKLKLNMKI